MYVCVVTEKDSGPSSRRAHAGSGSGSGSGANNNGDDGLSAFEKVMARKQERLVREEQERLDALKNAEEANRMHRHAAAQQSRNQYQVQHS